MTTQWFIPARTTIAISLTLRPAFLGGLFPTPLYHPALAGTPPEEGNWNHLGRLFLTRLYPYIPVGMDSGFRRNDEGGGHDHFSHRGKLFSNPGGHFRPLAGLNRE